MAILDKIAQSQRKLDRLPTDYENTANSRQTIGGDGKANPSVQRIYFQKRTGGNAVAGNHAAGGRPTKPDTASSLFILNDNYFLSASRNSRNDSWLLKSVQAKDETLTEKSNESYGTLGKLAVPSPFAKMLPLQLRFGDVPVADIPKLPSFVLDSASLRTADGIASFGFSYSFTPDGGVAISSVCSATFDLTGFGIPLKQTENSQSGPKDIRAFSLEQSLSQAGPNAFIYTSSRRVENKSEAKIVYSFDVVADGKVVCGKLPDAEFTASAYGLPEPPGFERPRTPLYVWLLLAAATFFVAGLVIRYVGRRASSRA